MSVVELDRRAGAPRTRQSPLDSWVRALELTSRIGEDPWRTFPSVIEELADRFGEAPALLSDRECFSFRALAERSNRYSRWALDQGVTIG
ncbi:MAG: long-chain-acyl-CoA synthetase, partial [Methylobacteriaceae bacterium]|nr:long-chain-acyl-CoA synthetase [Methylobacteriaceae bacterium]